MKLKDKYAMEIQAIQNDLNALIDGHIYEIRHVPGTPSYYTLGKRLETKFNVLLSKIESNAVADIEIAGAILSKME